jgi:hypothetical protein
MGKLRKPPSLLDPNRRAKEGVLSFAEGASLGLSASRRLRNGYKGPLVRVRRSYDNTELDIGYKYDPILEELVLNEEDLTEFVGHNLLTRSEFPNGLTDAPVRGGLISATTFTGYDGGIAFGYNGTTTSYASKNNHNYGTLVGGNATLSVFVEMDDGLAPNFGATAEGADSDFALDIGNIGVVPHTVEHISGSLYRVSATRFIPSATSNNTGVYKYAGNSNRTFKVTGYQLVAGSEPLPYQKTEANAYGGGFVTTIYDQSGNSFNATQATAASQPALVLAGVIQRINDRPAPKFDGVDDWLVTPTIDLTGTDKVNVYTAVRKLSDAAAASILEFSSSFSANAGTFHTRVVDANGSPNLSSYLRGTATTAVVTGSVAAPVSVIKTDSFKFSSAPYISSRTNLSEFSSATNPSGTVFGNFPLYLGARSNATTAFLNGHLSEVILYPNLNHAGTTAIDLNIMAHFNIP